MSVNLSPLDRRRLAHARQREDERADRRRTIIAVVLVVFALLVLVFSLGCRTADGKIDIDTTVDRAAEIAAAYCRANPERCGATPRPTATPARDPAASPSAIPTPCPEGMHRAGRDGCFYDTPPPTRGPSPTIVPVTPAPTVPPVEVTASPEPTPSSTPSPTPTATPCQRDGRCYDPLNAPMPAEAVAPYGGGPCPKPFSRVGGICSNDWRLQFPDLPGAKTCRDRLEDCRRKMAEYGETGDWCIDSPRPMMDAGCRGTWNGSALVWEPEAWCRDQQALGLDSIYCHPEQWASRPEILANVERMGGTGAYPVICQPCATPTPSPTATPGADSTPVPGPTPSSCPCLVVYTVALLGVNDQAHPVIRAGEGITLDATGRFARGDGDGRGMPCDMPERVRDVCKGRPCDPAHGPDWHVEQAPGGAWRQVNGGFGLAFRDLAPGTYRVRVSVPDTVLDQFGQPIRRCPWGHNDSVKDVVEFRVD